MEVVADKRLPLKHHNTVIDPVDGRRFARRLRQLKKKELLVVDRIAAISRRRREDLKKMYMTSLSPGATQATPSEVQEKVWSLYCTSLTAKQILIDGMSRIARLDDLKRQHGVQTIDLNDHPLYPPDHFPDRMVECRLCADFRPVIEATRPGVGSEEDAEHQFDFHTREAGEALAQKVASTRRSPPSRSMCFFLARRELFHRYSASKARYACGHCGKYFDYRKGVVDHLSSRSCVSIDVCRSRPRQKRIEEIERRAASHVLLTDYHTEKSPKTPADTAEFGNPFKLKKHKLCRMPPWLVFKAHRSSMYPEIYQSLKFRRGSQNRNFYDKMRDSKEYVSKVDRNRTRKRRARAKALEEAWI